MIRPAIIFRLLRIQRVLLRHGLDDLILATHLFRPFRFLSYLSPSFWLRRRGGPRGERIRMALEDLGPIFVKFGQILSTRQDLLPPDIGQELAKLQDKVPPFSGELAQHIIETALEQPVSDVFDHFDTTPLASASIAQVHPATLKDGTNVVVKVLRPDIARIIDHDVKLLYAMAMLADRYWAEARRVHPLDIVAEFDKTIHDELDLVREASNASQLRRNFENSDKLYVPAVFWPLIRKNVMVMERVYGTPIGQIDTLKAQNVDMQLLAERGVEIFFSQVFRDNFFHADMHPGNIFATPDARYLAVDFGIMGSVSLNDQRYLAENFLAFFNRDYLRVAVLHVESGWVPAKTRVDEFEAAIRAVCEPIFERPLKEISYGHLLLRLFQTARRFDMEVQPQLVLLQKTLLNIEGLGRQLYPDLDLWKTAKPYLEEWYHNQIGPKATWKKLKQHLPAMGEKLPELPELAYQVLHKAAHNQLEVQMRSEDMESIRKMMRTNHRRNIMAITGGSFVVASAVLLALDGYAAKMILGAPLSTWVTGGFGVLLLSKAWDFD